MADIAWGSAYEFPVVTGDGGETPEGQAQQLVACEVADNKLVIAYVFAKADASDSEDGRVLVATVDGEEVSYGDEYVFGSPCLTQVSPVGLCKLDTDKFVVMYHIQLNGTPGPIVARIGTVSGNTISFGASREIGEVLGISHWSAYLSCCSLGIDKFAVAYRDDTGGDIGMATVCTVSGTTITTGEPVSFYGNKVVSNHCCKVADDKFLVTYTQWSDSLTYGVVATVSGTVPSFGSTYLMHSVRSRNFVGDKLEDNKLALAWNTGVQNVDRSGLAAVITISGTTITIGDKVETHPSGGTGPGDIDMVALGKNTFIHAFTDSSPAVRDPGLTQYSTIANSTITLGDKEEWDSGTASDTNMFLVDSTGIFKLAVVYKWSYSGDAKYYTRIGTAAPYTPLVTTDPATSVLKVSALMHGTLDDDGGEACTCAFEWGLTTSYGNSVEVSTTRTTGQTFQGTATGLLPSTTYHFRAKATNSDGTGYGADRTFTTEGGLFPSVSTTRVSSLVHRWVPGSYTLEMVLGGITSEFGLIIPTGKPAPTIPTLPVCQSDEVLTWSLEKGYYCMKVSDIPPGKY